MRGPASREAEDVEEELLEAVVAADREPLHFVLVGARLEAEQLGDAAVEIAERIGEVLLLIERHLRAARLPARAAAEIAAAVERRAPWLRRTGKGSRPTRRAPGDAPPRGCGCSGTARAA